MSGAVIFSLFVLLPLTILAQSEGDVRLADSTHANLGRLEIFWKGKWSTFCGLSKGGAQAACRQLGYLDAHQYKPLNEVNPDLNITEAEPETPIAIDYTECERSFSNGLYHILRCGYSTKVEDDCNHANDIVLQCQTTSLWTHPYDTQVRLTSNSTFSGDMNNVATSSGTLEIYLNGEWGNVCDDDFTKAAADSACRQMGYTSASSYSSISEHSVDVVWLRDISCQGKNAKSCDCLSGCFGSNPTKPTTCSQDKVAHVTCTYDVSIQDKAPSGTRDICENKQSACNGPSGGGGLSGGAVAGIVFVVLVVVVLVIVVAVVVVVVGIPKWKKRDYSAVN